MITLKSARNPSWNAKRTMITMDAIFLETEDTLGEIPFSSSPDDSAVHGREIYERAYAGEFGDIAEPVEAEVLSSFTLQRNAESSLATAKINALQTSLEIVQDAVKLENANISQIDSVPQLNAELDAWRTYRVHLAQMESQAGFPLSVKWPEPPAQPFISSLSEDSGVNETLAE